MNKERDGEGESIKISFKSTLTNMMSTRRHSYGEGICSEVRWKNCIQVDTRTSYTPNYVIHRNEKDGGLKRSINKA